MLTRIKLVSFFIFLFGVSCQNLEKQNNDEPVLIDTPMIDHPLRCVVDIHGWKFDTLNKVQELRVSRMVNTSSLKRDSLCYWIDKDDWYSQIPSKEGDINYYVEMAIKDIDTNLLLGDLRQDNFRVRIVMADSGKIRISKLAWDGSHSIKLWEINPDTVYLDYPSDLTRIKKEFTSYLMFHPKSDCTADYIDAAYKSISTDSMIGSLIRSIKQGVKGLGSN